MSTINLDGMTLIQATDQLLTLQNMLNEALQERIDALTEHAENGGGCAPMAYLWRENAIKCVMLEVRDQIQARWGVECEMRCNNCINEQDLRSMLVEAYMEGAHDGHNRTVDSCMVLGAELREAADEWLADWIEDHPFPRGGEAGKA